MEEISKQTILQPLTLDPDSQEVKNEIKDNNWLCLFCEYIERNEKDSKKILQHLYFTHRLVIADANEIGDLKEYLKFWKEQFKGNNVTD